MLRRPQNFIPGGTGKGKGLSLLALLRSFLVLVPRANTWRKLSSNAGFLLTQHSADALSATIQQHRITPYRKKNHGHSPEVKQCDSQLAASVFVIPKVTPILAAQCEEIPQIPRGPYLFIRGGIGTLSGAAAPRRGSNSSQQLPRAWVWSPHGARRAPHACAFTVTLHRRGSGCEGVEKAAFRRSAPRIRPFLTSLLGAHTSDSFIPPLCHRGPDVHPAGTSALWPRCRHCWGGAAAARRCEVRGAGRPFSLSRCPARCPPHPSPPPRRPPPAL